MRSKPRWEKRLPGITRNPRPNRSCFFSKSTYCLLVLLDPVCGVELLPEPRPEPLLAAPGVVGVVLVELSLELPMLPEDEPEPAPLR